MSASFDDTNHTSSVILIPAVLPVVKKRCRPFILGARTPILSRIDESARVDFEVTIEEIHGNARQG